MQTRSSPPQARRAQQESSARQRRVVSIAAAAIIIVVVALVALRLVSSNSAGAGAPNQPAPDSLVAQVTSLDPAIFEPVGKGSLQTMPIPIRASLERGPNGLPLVTYVGAEYCPFCAGERWPLIVALSRFGTFSGLELSHSSTTDVYPNTSTFSFVNATYSSPTVDFSSVELQSNVRSGNGYAPLQTPTPGQESLLRTYDAAPYVPAQSAGSIPFIDFGGQYMVSGASYDVGSLRGMTQEQVAAQLTNPSSPQTQAIIGSANVLTAAICSATGDTPGNVCGQAPVKSLEAQLAASPVAGKG